MRKADDRVFFHSMGYLKTVQLTRADITSHLYESLSFLQSHKFAGCFKNVCVSNLET